MCRQRAADARRNAGDEDPGHGWLKTLLLRGAFAALVDHLLGQRQQFVMVLDVLADDEIAAVDDQRRHARNLGRTRAGRRVSLCCRRTERPLNARRTSLASTPCDTAHLGRSSRRPVQPLDVDGVERCCVELLNSPGSRAYRTGHQLIERAVETDRDTLEGDVRRQLCRPFLTIGLRSLQCGQAYVGKTRPPRSWRIVDLGGGFDFSRSRRRPSCACAGRASTKAEKRRCRRQDVR